MRISLIEEGNMHGLLQDSLTVYLHASCSDILDQRQEFRRAEIEKFYEDKFAQPSLRMADSPGPGTPIGKLRHILILTLDDLPPEKSFSVGPFWCGFDIRYGQAWRTEREKLLNTLMTTHTP